MLRKTYSVLILALICVLSLCVALSACTGDSSGGGSSVLCADGVHDYGEFIVQIEPNCYRAGVEYRVCSHCNYRDYRDIEKTNEHKKVIIPEVKATCSSNGLTEGERCEDCGEVFVLCNNRPSVCRTPKKLFPR